MEEIADPEIIISPDTRRNDRIPPGQSRTKKWPILDAHGTPEVDLKRAAQLARVFEMTPVRL